MDELLRDERRHVRQRQTLSGMVQIEMQLPPEEAAAMVLAAMVVNIAQEIQSHFMTSLK